MKYDKLWSVTGMGFWWELKITDNLLTASTALISAYRSEQCATLFSFYNQSTWNIRILKWSWWSAYRTWPNYYIYEFWLDSLHCLAFFWRKWLNLYEKAKQKQQKMCVLFSMAPDFSGFFKIWSWFITNNALLWLCCVIFQNELSADASFFPICRGRLQHVQEASHL